MSTGSLLGLVGGVWGEGQCLGEVRVSDGKEYMSMTDDAKTANILVYFPQINSVRFAVF